MPSPPLSGLGKQPDRHEFGSQAVICVHLWEKTRLFSGWEVAAAETHCCREPQPSSLNPQPMSQIQRAADPQSGPCHYVRIKLRRAHVHVAQQVLERANVHA